MVATLCILGCVLASGQAPLSPVQGRRANPAVRPVGGNAAQRPGPAIHLRHHWVLTPRFQRALEGVYQGTFKEAARSKGVEMQRSYRFMTRLFVLDTPPRGASLALFTAWKPLRSTREGGTKERSSSWSVVRLQRVDVDLQGKILPDQQTDFRIPLQGVPSLECGMFIQAPRASQRVGDTWEQQEASRPPCTWKVVGSEMVNGVRCVKLIGVQQSSDWDRPRADHAGWHRQDTVWIDPQFGLACRVERIIRRRDPGRYQPTQQSILRYDRETVMQFPGRLSEDRRQEILQTLAFQKTLQPLLAQPARHTRELEVLLRRIAYHLENQPPSPYRAAVLAVRRQAEAARRGEVPPTLPEEKGVPVHPANLGLPAPDFLVPNLITGKSARLSSWMGQPILLVFYNPQAPSARRVLPYAQSLHASGQKFTVLGMAVSGEASRVQKQTRALGLTFPILDGKGLRISYLVEATPLFVVIDSKGIVRGRFLGWGQEIPLAVMEELRRWLPGLERHHRVTKPHQE
jgi:peroxiredoxin